MIFLITSLFLNDQKEIKISVNIMKFALVTFSLANSQIVDISGGHSLPPGLRVPDSVRNQFQKLSKDEKRVPGKKYRGGKLPSGRRTSL